MGILDAVKKMTNSGPTKATSRTVVVITPLGKTKAEKFDLPGVKWRILGVLNEEGPCTLRELASTVGMEEDRLKAVCKDLAAEGYIRKAGGTE